MTAILSTMYTFSFAFTLCLRSVEEHKITLKGNRILPRPPTIFTLDTVQGDSVHGFGDLALSSCTNALRQRLVTRNIKATSHALRGGEDVLSESEEFFSESVGEDTKEDLNNTQAELNSLTAEMNEVLVRLSAGSPKKVPDCVCSLFSDSAVRVTSSFDSRIFQDQGRDHI